MSQTHRPHRSGLILALVLMLLASCTDKESPVAPGLPTAIAFSDMNLRLASLGETAQLSVTVRDQHGQPMPGVSVSWASSEPGIASVGTSGLVTAHANGTAMIQASAGEVSATVPVVVEQVPASMTMAAAFVRLPSPGDTLKLEVVVRDAKDVPVDGARPTWASSDPQVAQVSENGGVTARANGVTIITAEIGALSSSTTVLVQPVSPQVSLARRTHTFNAVGDTLRMAASVKGTDGGLLVGVTPEWSSADPSVASVSAEGIIRAEGFGTTEILATLDGISWGVTVRVDNPLRLVIRNPEIYSFVDATRMPDYEYAGEQYRGGLVSILPQGSGAFDLWTGSGPDAFVPLVLGYASGIDTRTKPLFFRNDGGQLVHATDQVEVPRIAGVRHTIRFGAPNDPFSGIFAVQHDTHDGRMADILLVAAGSTPQNMTHRVDPLPLMEITGRPTAVNAHSVAGGDITGNGRTDFVVGDWGDWSGRCTSCAPYFLIQDETGRWRVHKDPFLAEITFRQPMVDPGAGQGFNLLIDLHLADLNGNGLADLVTGYGHGSTPSFVYFNQGGGTFTKAASMALPTPPFGINNSLHLRTRSLDLTGNGALDLVITWSRYEPYYAGYAHQILINDGRGNFRDETAMRFRSIAEFEAPVERLSWSDTFEWIDVNGDGYLDFLGIDRYHGRVRLWLNNGAGVFSETPVEVDSGNGRNFGQPVAWADFSGTGTIGFLVKGGGWTDEVGTAQRITFSYWEFDRILR